MTQVQISTFDKTIDVRDIIERVEELRDVRNTVDETHTAFLEASGAYNAARTIPQASEAERNARKTDMDEARRVWIGASEDFTSVSDELRTLEALLEDLAGYGGDHQWEGVWYPVTLIRDDYFENYAQELCEEIGDMPKGFPSYIEIDWEATARNIRQDYSSTEFDGVTYWYR